MTRVEDRLSVGHDHRDERHLREELERWMAADVISAAQADAILQLEAARPTEPPARRIPLVAEALGFLGGALAAIAGVTTVSRFWADLTTAGRIGVVGSVGALLLLAGIRVRRAGEPALDRLGSFLWLLATGCAAFVAGIVAVDVVGWEGADLAMAVGAASTVAAAALWAWRPAPLQHVATLAAAAVLVAGTGAQVAHVGGRFAGIGLWALGATWVTLAWRGWLRPRPLGHALGGVVVVVAGQVLMANGDGAGESVFAVASAVALLAASVPARDLSLLWVGVGGIFLTVPSAVSLQFGDSDLAPLALLVVGLVLIGTAVGAAGLMRRVQAQPLRPARVSAAATTAGVGAVIVAVVAVLAATTRFVGVPSFASLQETPDPALRGTVAFVRRAGDETCIHLAAASGGADRRVRCRDDLEPAPLSWTDDGLVVATVIDHDGGGPPRMIVVDPATGAVVDRRPVKDAGATDLVGGPERQDGSLLMTESGEPGQARLSVQAPGGSSHVVATVEGPVDYGFTFATWSPDGRHAVVADTEERLLVVEVEGGDGTIRVLVDDASGPAWGTYEAG